MDTHLCRAVCRYSVCFRDVCPQHSGGAELCYFHEIVGAYGEGEFHLACYRIGCQTEFCELREIFASHCKSECQFLYDSRACIVEYVRAYCYHSELWQAFGGFDQRLGQCKRFACFAVERAFQGQATQGIVVDRSAYFVNCQGFAFYFSDNLLHCFQRVAATCFEVSFDAGHSHISHQSIEIFVGQSVFATHTISDCVGSFHQDVQDKRIVGFGASAVSFNGLAYFPPVVGGYTSHERKLAWSAFQMLQIHKVFGTIIGAYIEALRGFPHQFFIVVGSFQVFCNHCFPLLRNNGGKFGKQLFCHT